MVLTACVHIVGEPQQQTVLPPWYASQITLLVHYAVAQFSMTFQPACLVTMWSGALVQGTKHPACILWPWVAVVQSNKWCMLHQSKCGAWQYEVAFAAHNLHCCLFSWKHIQHCSAAVLVILSGVLVIAAEPPLHQPSSLCKSCSLTFGRVFFPQGP